VVLNLAGYTITGKIEDATTTVVEATFTVDVNGNETVSYSNGATGTIAAFGVDS
jgi:hypothetical protein